MISILWKNLKVNSWVLSHAEAQRRREEKEFGVAQVEYSFQLLLSAPLRLCAI